MPVYHSAYNTEQGSQTLGGVLPLLPLKDAARGPAPALSDATARDVVEEALYFFRSNCLFQSFKIDSSADLVMVYVTLFIHQCLKRLEAARPSHMADAQRLLTTLAITDLQQPVPGIAGWPLDGLVPAPADSGQSDSLKSYLRQLRETTVPRLVARVYSGVDDGQGPDKHWVMFARRRFMNRELP